MLTDVQKQMIDLAAGNYKYAGSLEDLAKRQFGLSPTRFWQDVNRLIATEAAYAYRPDVVRRLADRRRPQRRLQQRIMSA